MALSTTQYGYIIDPMVPFTDGKGNTIKNGFVRVFVAGSSTPVVTYRNFDGAANQDLIELDNSGRTKTSVIGSKGLTYKVCVYDHLHSQESPILTVDKVSVIGANITAGTGATVVTGLDGLTTKPDGFVDASVVGTDGYVALDHTLVEDDLDTDAKATAVENDRYIPLLNEDVNDPDSKMTLGRLWQWVLGKIKSLSTTITAFRTGDYIPVDGPLGPAKMEKDDLLREAAENTLKWNVAPAFEATIDYVVGNIVTYGGKNYRFFTPHSAGAWIGSDVDEINLSENEPTMDNCGFEQNFFEANDVAGKTISYDITNCPLTRGFMGYTGNLVKQNNTAFTKFPLYGVKKIKVYAATFAGSSSIAYIVVTNKAGDQILGVVLSNITQDKEISFDVPTEGIVYFNLLSKNFSSDVARKFDVTFFSSDEVKLFEEKFPVVNKLEFSRNGYTKSDTGANVTDSGNNWFNTNFLRTDGVVGLKFKLRTNSAAASIAFYDSSRTYIQSSSVIYASGAEHSGIITIPPGAKYYVVCSALQSLPSSYVVEMREKIDEEKLPVAITTCQKNKKCLNIIGDSISEGVSCTTDYTDSWAGILRNLVAIENGGSLNYGFASYPDLDELRITNTMVKPLGRGGWSRNYAGTTLYGNNEFTASSSSTMKFSLAKEMHYMQVSFLGGSTQGSFSVLRRDPQNNDTVLATIDCSQYASGCHKSDPIDISSVGLSDTIRITSADTTPVTISGFFFSDNADYFMFNNFGHAGLQPSHTEGVLLELETDCDVLIYALGVNGGAVANETAYEAIEDTLKSCKAVKYVVDFCLFTSSRDNREKSCDIKALAKNVGATYIRMYDELPKDADGHTIADLLKADGLHPNDAGHKYIAEVIAKKLGLSITSKSISLSGKLDGGWV